MPYCNSVLAQKLQLSLPVSNGFLQHKKQVLERSESAPGLVKHECHVLTCAVRVFRISYGQMPALAPHANEDAPL